MVAVNSTLVNEETIAKAFKNVMRGKDDELADAFSEFRKKVEHETNIIHGLTYANSSKLSEGIKTMLTEKRGERETIERTDRKASDILTGTQSLRQEQLGECGNGSLAT